MHKTGGTVARQGPRVMPREQHPPRPSLGSTLCTSPPPPASHREKVPKGLRQPRATLSRLPKGWSLRGETGRTEPASRLLRGAAGLPFCPLRPLLPGGHVWGQSHTAGQGKGLDRHLRGQPFRQVTDKGGVPAAPAAGTAQTPRSLAPATDGRAHHRSEVGKVLWDVPDGTTGDSREEARPPTALSGGSLVFLWCKP